MAKKTAKATPAKPGAGLSAEIEVVTSVDQGEPGNRLAVITEILVFVEGRLTEVKRGHVRTLDVATNEKPGSPQEKPAEKRPSAPAKPAKSSR